MALRGLFDIVGDLNADRNSQLNVIERPADRHSTRPNLVEEDVGRLAEERVADPAVGCDPRQS